MGPHGYYRHGGHGFGRRLFWFLIGAGAATYWHKTHEAREWRRTHCWRDRIPQEAYPAPGQPAFGPAESDGMTCTLRTYEPDAAPAEAQEGSSAAKRSERKGQWMGWAWREETERDKNGNWERRWSWSRAPPSAGPAPELAPAPKSAAPQPPAQPVQGWEEESRSIQELSKVATETFNEMSEATLESLLTHVQSLKAKIAESRAKHEEELRNQRFAQYKEYEEWKKQHAEQEKEPRRLV